ncbi:S4 domain-containing protein YaaA [Paenibacillus sp. GCM10012307]|uniref:S4 domain-containing protein YaaA n=1 Tax=Paenibacillus roseus TaxID=2798579 RepID=A0A934J7H1_9BACL|nr:S4 domain-containing protein YaaA [Paenibacillus roseus]MBJ6361693.1 S4 domain-containing protein YaaA [Paenibacillus roseus]
MTEVKISTEYITLGQFLKLADCIDSGGQAKFFLMETKVHINGEPDNRRGRKLYKGDRLEVEGHGFFIVAER